MDCNHVQRSIIEKCDMAYDAAKQAKDQVGNYFQMVEDARRECRRVA